MSDEQHNEGSMDGLPEKLAAITQMVANEHKGPHCVEASALLVAVGSVLGIDLVARPVSVFAVNYRTLNTQVTGTKGRAFAEVFVAARGLYTPVGEFEGGGPFERHAGHMIVTAEKNRLLLHPTFAQFQGLEEVATPIFVSEIDARGGKNQYWSVGDETFHVRYFSADEYGVDNFEVLVDRARERAAQLVAAAAA